MKTKEIQTLFAQFENATATVEDIECWSARDLQHLLGYAKFAHRKENNIKKNNKR